MKDFSGKIAVITGGGTGMGRALAKQLIAEGAHVAICDVIEENMAATKEMCAADAPQGVRITSHLCDVSDEDAVLRFRDEVMDQHNTDHIHLCFNNAGVGGGGSFIEDDRENWERTFDICWNGVYFCSRAFVPLLIAADEGHLINTSSVNGFWASLGPDSAHTAYSASKFAVKGFTEALVNDFRLNAPHVKVSLVMPGHIGTSIVANSGRILTGHSLEEMSSEDLEGLRERIAKRGIDPSGISDDDLKGLMKEQARHFEEDAPMTADAAAKVILDGVRNEDWRILIGDDAHGLDELVRSKPRDAYERDFYEEVLATTKWQLGTLSG